MASEYDSLLEEAPQSSEYDALLAPEPQESPGIGEIIGRAGQAALDVGKGLAQSVFHVPKPTELAALALGPVGVATHGIIEQIKGVPETIHQVQEAEQTPAYSQERFSAGANVASQLAMIALGEPVVKGFRALRGKVGVPKTLTEVVKGVEEPITPEVAPVEPQPMPAVEPVKAEPVAAEPIAQPAPEAVAPVAAPTEKISSSAWKLPDGKVVSTGPLHGEPPSPNAEAGFLTTDGRYLDRTQAGELATGLKQELRGEDFFQELDVVPSLAEHPIARGEPTPASVPTEKPVSGIEEAKVAPEAVAPVTAEGGAEAMRPDFITTPPRLGADSTISAGIDAIQKAVEPWGAHSAATDAGLTNLRVALRKYGDKPLDSESIGKINDAISDLPRYLTGDASAKPSPVSVPTEATTAQPLPETAAKGDLWYQGVSKEGATQWVTHDINIAKSYASRRGKGAKINVYTPEQIGETAFADPEGNLISPQEYAKHNWSTTIQTAGEKLPKPTKTLTPEEVISSASEITSPESVTQSEVRTQVGEGTPLRQQGEVATAQKAEPQAIPQAGEVAAEKVQTGEFQQSGYTAVDTPAETAAKSRGEETGIAARYREDELGPGSVIPGVGKTADQARSWGHDFINKGGNPYDAINQKGPKRELWQDVGIARAEHERLGIEKRNAEAALETNPNDPLAQMAFDNADLAQRQWSKDVQPVLTRAGDALRAASRSYPREINTFSDFTDIVNDHFGGAVELNPLQRAELFKATKAIKKGNLEATEVRQRVTNEAIKKANGKVMDSKSLGDDLRGTMEQLLKDCVL